MMKLSDAGDAKASFKTRLENIHVATFNAEKSLNHGKIFQPYLPHCVTILRHFKYNARNPTPVGGLVTRMNDPTYQRVALKIGEDMRDIKGNSAVLSDTVKPRLSVFQGTAQIFAFKRGCL